VVTFIVVDAEAQYHLFGRDWMSLLGINVSSLILQATQVHSTVEGPSTHESLLAEYADVFKEELGVLKEIEAVITVGEHATPKFHRNRPVPFAIKEKKEQALQAQVDEGELIPVERSEWAAPIAVVHKHDGGIRICGDFKVTVNPVICLQPYPLPTPEEIFTLWLMGSLILN